MFMWYITLCSDVSRCNKELIRNYSLCLNVYNFTIKWQYNDNIWKFCILIQSSCYVNIKNIKLYSIYNMLLYCSNFIDCVHVSFEDKCAHQNITYNLCLCVYVQSSPKLFIPIGLDCMYACLYLLIYLFTCLFIDLRMLFLQKKVTFIFFRN